MRAGSLQVTRPAFALQLEEAERGCALARVFSKEICNEATTFHNSTRSWVFGVDTVALIADCVVGAGIQSTGCQRAHTLSVDNPLVGAAGALAVELVAQPVRVPQDHTLLPALLCPDNSVHILLGRSWTPIVFTIGKHPQLFPLFQRQCERFAKDKDKDGGGGEECEGKKGERHSAAG